MAASTPRGIIIPGTDPTVDGVTPLEKWFRDLGNSTDTAIGNAEKTAGRLVAKAIRTVTTPSIGGSNVILASFTATVPGADGTTEYEIDFWSQLQATTAADRLTIYIYRGTTQVGSSNFVLGYAGVPIGIFARTRDTPPAGDAAYTVQARVGGGAGTMQVVGTPTAPSTLSVRRA